MDISPLPLNFLPPEEQKFNHQLRWLYLLWKAQGGIHMKNRFKKRSRWTLPIGFYCTNELISNNSSAPMRWLRHFLRNGPLSDGEHYDLVSLSSKGTMSTPSKTNSEADASGSRSWLEDDPHLSEEAHKAQWEEVRKGSDELLSYYWSSYGKWGTSWWN